MEDRFTTDPKAHFSEVEQEAMLVAERNDLEALESIHLEQGETDPRRIKMRHRTGGQNTIERFMQLDKRIFPPIIRN